MLIILSGLPGSGKTTIARALAVSLSAVHVKVDTIEQAIVTADVLKGDVGPAGYSIAYGLSADNLKLGHRVIADSVNPVAESRAAWRECATECGTSFVEIEIVCSDAHEHRRRIETRTTDVKGLIKPSWEQVRARHYEPWDREIMVVDTATASPLEIAQELAATLGRDTASAI